ncbi:hypothetical protein K0M31_004892 [Melipona bicolor]|uniref:Uncharacterized protein n=1 Tax=Melipona bicolor TaxID=60889 RepID=A0AA40FVP3_9HYME|nr:hypothetical protein K0M31_004892 [Melipona bicolor]
METGRMCTGPGVRRTGRMGGGERGVKRGDEGERQIYNQGQIQFTRIEYSERVRREHVEEIEEQERTKERSTLGEGKRMESKLPLGGGLVYRSKGRGEKLKDETARVCGGEKIREEEERERGCREVCTGESVADGR